MLDLHSRVTVKEIELAEISNEYVFYELSIK